MIARYATSIAVGILASAIAIALVQLAQRLLPATPPAPIPEVVRADEPADPTIRVVRVYDLRDLMTFSVEWRRSRDPWNNESAFQIPRSFESEAAAVFCTLAVVLLWDGDGDAEYWAGRLVVTATPPGHARFQAALQQLRNTFLQDRNR